MQLIKRLIIVFNLLFFVLGELIKIYSDTTNNQINFKGIRKENDRKTISLTQFIFAHEAQNFFLPKQSVPLINLTYQQYLAKYKPQKLQKRMFFKNYKQEAQDIYRAAIFNQNLKLINQFNQDPSNTFKKGLNQFADIQLRQFYTLNKVTINPEYFTRVYGPLNKLPQEQTFKQSVNKYLIDLKKEKSDQKSIVDDLVAAFREPPKIYGRVVTFKQYMAFVKYEKSTPPRQFIKLNMFTVPENITIDWRKQSGKVSFQGLCNACYAFAAVDSIYTTQRIRNISGAQPLSAQEIISCIKQYSDESDGCIGGLPQNVYLYIRDRGVGPQRLNPFSTLAVVSREEGNCDKTLIESSEYKKNKLRIYDYNTVPLGDCRKIVNLLKTTSLSVIITGRDLQFYKQGVYRNPYTWLSDAKQLDHAVSLVGYNATDGSFMIRNSWGTPWGLQGFGFVDRRTGVCAVAYYPILTLSQ